MSTLTVALKNGRVAIAADALTTFEDLKVPPGFDAHPEKVFAVGDAYVGVVGFTAHHLVLQSALNDMAEESGPDFSSREGVFETFLALHDHLKEHYYLRPEREEDDPYESTQMTVLVASPHGIYGVYDLREVHAYTRFWAMGSGSGYALGAMDALYDGAESAAELAEAGVRAGCRFDRNSGEPVVSYDLPLVSS